MAKSPKARELLSALERGGAVPFPPEQVTRARELISQPAPVAAEVEALPGPLALAVLEAQVRAKRPELASALASSAHKELAKAAKRALYQLKSTGVAVPEPATKPVEAAPSAPEPELESAGLLSALTGDGERALVLVRPVRGGLELWQAVLSDERGVVSLSMADATRGNWRKQLKELRSAKQPPAFEIDLARAKQELAQAAGRNLATKTPFPPGLSPLLANLEVRPVEALPDVPAPEPEDERRALSGQALHEQPEIQQWLPSEPELRLLAEKMDSVVTSPLALSPQQRSDQLLQTFRTEAQAWFTPEVKRLYGRRLWAMAEFFEQTGRENAAQVAKAEARRLFHNAPGAPSRFAEFLFEKVLLMTAMDATIQAETRQQEAAGQEKPASETTERKSPGGLILP